MPERVSHFPQTSILFHPHWWRWRVLPPRPTAFRLIRITLMSVVANGFDMQAARH
jgi:hypothetical protein